MLIAIDKRGSINLPASIRKDLALEIGTYLDLTVQDGGAVLLRPMTVYPTIRLSDDGFNKLNIARSSGAGEMPDWLVGEIKNAATDSK
jgi:AbrB family looped-hinge helix DNA binding protein